MNKLLLIMLLAAALPVSADDGAAARIAEQAAACSAQAAQATEPLRTEKYRQAAALYQQLHDNFGIRSGSLFYNMGNAWFDAGNYPEAILNYRRAQLYAPGNPEVQANLNLARTQVRDHFPQESGNSALKTLFFWHYDTSFQFRIRWAAAAAALFWICAAVLLWKRQSWLKYAAAILFIAAAAPALSAAVTACTLRNTTPAVIMADQVMPRKGPAESYAPAFDKPIHAGAEVQVTDRQGEWREIQIPGNISGWVHESGLQTL
ncbi:MAG: hypothetical protein J6S21_07260 [Victivallales bacterium]|nr:hypothetical protein [Victivallales bacterium]